MRTKMVINTKTSILIQGITAEEDKLSIALWKTNP